MEAFLAAFILGTFWWYAVSLSYIFWCFFLVEKESVGWCFISLAIYLVFLQFLGKVDIFGRFVANPVWAPVCVLSYFIIGFAWSFGKWWLLNRERAELYEKEVEKFFENSKRRETSAVPEQYRKDKCENLKMDWGRNRAPYEKLKFSENKEKISVWIVYWPYSFLWSLMNDIVKRVIRQLITHFQKVYQAITDSAYKGLDIDSQIAKRLPKEEK